MFESLSTCNCLYHMGVVFLEASRGCKFRGTGVKDGGEVSYGFWELDPGSLTIS